METSQESQKTIPYSLWALTKYFLWLGSIGFGGPMALIGYMQQTLVVQRQWIQRAEFLNGLALSSLCPGPVATQVAIYLGWLKSGAFGATVILIAFTLPAFLLILGLAISYHKFAHLPWVMHASLGGTAAIIAILIRNTYRLSNLIIVREHWLWIIFTLIVLLSIFTTLGVYTLILSSGVLVWVIKHSPFRKTTNYLFALPLLSSFWGFSQQPLILKIFLYFAWAGTVVFGSGFAIIPLIHEGVVQQYHWLTEQQFLDSISVGLMTPGPITLSVSFMGYLIAGVKGALAAAIGVFLPCYLCVILFAPHFHRIAHHESVRSFVQGVTIAAAATIAAVIVHLMQQTLGDNIALGIFIATSLALYFLSKIPEPLWIIIAAGASILLKMA